MSLAIALVLAVFFLPSPWGVIVVVLRDRARDPRDQVGPAPREGALVDRGRGAGGKARGGGDGARPDGTGAAAGRALAGTLVPRGRVGHHGRDRRGQRARARQSPRSGRGHSRRARRWPARSGRSCSRRSTAVTGGRSARCSSRVCRRTPATTEARRRSTSPSVQGEAWPVGELLAAGAKPNERERRRLGRHAAVRRRELGPPLRACGRCSPRAPTRARPRRTDSRRSRGPSAAARRRRCRCCSRPAPTRTRRRATAERRCCWPQSEDGSRSCAS